MPFQRPDYLTQSLKPVARVCWPIVAVTMEYAVKQQKENGIGVVVPMIFNMVPYLVDRFLIHLKITQLLMD